MLYFLSICFDKLPRKIHCTDKFTFMNIHKHIYGMAYRILRPQPPIGCQYKLFHFDTCFACRKHGMSVRVFLYGNGCRH